SVVLIFIALPSLFLVIGVYWGWRLHGLVGVAWAFLASRAVVVIQDLFVIRLIEAGGWLSARTWQSLGLQIVVGFVFFCMGLFWPRESLWQTIPACFHAIVMAAMLLRHPARIFLLRSA